MDYSPKEIGLESLLGRGHENVAELLDIIGECKLYSFFRIFFWGDLFHQAWQVENRNELTCFCYGGVILIALQWVIWLVFKILEQVDDAGLLRYH
jgi:hypothetical protein